MKKIIILIFCCNVLLISTATGKKPRFSFELEGGLLFQSRNEVQVPNEDTATRIDLLDPLGTGPFPVGRFYATWNINNDHALRLLLAPLAASAKYTNQEDVVFDGETFNAGDKTDYYYKFNSWRLGYSYRFLNLKNFKARVGFTAKIRDARVTVKNSSGKGEITDLGFVPLLYLYFDYTFLKDFHLIFDFNGLAGGPGRAFDIALKVQYDLNDSFSVNLGYRTIEGGADVDSVYNFAWLHYGVLGLVYNY